MCPPPKGHGGVTLSPVKGGGGGLWRDSYHPYTSCGLFVGGTLVRGVREVVGGTGTSPCLRLSTSSLCCHNGASIAISAAYLPPQESLFTHCHHSWPSLPQNVMVSEGPPFIPLSLRLCVSFPLWTPLPSPPPTLEEWPVSGVLGLTPVPPQEEALPALFWSSVPLAKANQTPDGSRRERDTGGLIVCPFITETSWPERTLSDAYSHTHSWDNVHTKWQLLLGLECMWMERVQRNATVHQRHGNVIGEWQTLFLPSSITLRNWTSPYRIKQLMEMLRN